MLNLRRRLTASILGISCGLLMTATVSMAVAKDPIKTPEETGTACYNSYSGGNINAHCTNCCGLAYPQNPDPLSDFTRCYATCVTGP